MFTIPFPAVHSSDTICPYTHNQGFTQSSLSSLFLFFLQTKARSRKTPPQKDNKKPILRISVEEPAENPQALLFAHVRKGRKQPVNCPRPRYLRSAAKNDLSIRVKPQPYMGKMRACGVPYALILAYASQKQLPKFGCS